MQREDRDAAYLLDALEAARRIASYVIGMTFDAYLRDPKTRAAVERELITIGEAFNRLSSTMTSAHPNIAIPGAIGLRNRIIHEYDRLAHETIFRIATEQVPELVDTLTPLVPPLPPDPEPRE